MYGIRGVEVRRGPRTRRELKWKRLDNGSRMCIVDRVTPLPCGCLARTRCCPTPVRRRVGVVSLGEQYAFVPCFPTSWVTCDTRV